MHIPDIKLKFHISCKLKNSAQLCKREKVKEIVTVSECSQRLYC